MIRAAGGVLWRRSPHGRIEVAVIGRDRYGDWTLPKGKLEPGEWDLESAVREVREETGARVAVGRRLGSVHYDARGQAKLVTFWSMRHCGGEFAPSDEVRELRWLPIAAAREQLTYDTDRNALAALDPIPEALVVLVRHAKAGKRSEWDGEDADRPLEPSGRTQADRLADVLPLFVPTGVFSAGLVRCRQTVSPLAERLGRVVAEAPRFADEVSAADPEATVAALRALATRDAVTVVCSQGETIPRLVATLTGRESVQTRKGAFWVLGFTGGSCVSADYYSAR